VFDGTVEFSADDSSNRFRKRSPDAFPYESIWSAGSERNSFPVQLGKAPLTVEYEEAVADSIKNQVAAEAWPKKTQNGSTS